MASWTWRSICPGDEFRDLGSSFEAISAQLSAVRTQELPASATDFESVMDNLEDAMALFSPEGDLMFANSSMRGVLPSLAADAGGSARLSRGCRLTTRCGSWSSDRWPAAARRDRCRLPSDPHAESDPEPAERLLMCHAIEDTNGRFLGVMLVARNLGFLSHVHSTLNYSRKLAALGRLMAGVAHEVKNPLNAMTIHLELLRQKLAALPQPIVVPDGFWRHAVRSIPASTSWSSAMPSAASITSSSAS